MIWVSAEFIIHYESSFPSQPARSHTSKKVVRDIQEPRDLLLFGFLSFFFFFLNCNLPPTSFPAMKQPERWAKTFKNKSSRTDKWEVLFRHLPGFQLCYMFSGSPSHAIFVSETLWKKLMWPQLPIRKTSKYGFICLTSGFYFQNLCGRLSERLITQL